MIIWHMTNLLAGVSTVTSNAQYVWKTDAFRMEHGRKVSFLIVIEGSFHRITLSGVTGGHF
jgi:hypothetical protein